jgi:molybdenum cofactor cytidylyltransferase
MVIICSILSFSCDLFLLFYHKIRYNTTVRKHQFGNEQQRKFREVCGMEYTENTAVGCVIMASGRAVRFGSNKLLADFGGAPLIVRALDAAETPALAARVVVTRSPEVAELACKAGVKAILHSLPGRNDTVRLGLEALLSELPGLAGCIFLPGDQPLLRKESLEAMARDFSALNKKERAILRLGFRAEDGTERLGSPVLFGSSYFGALCSLPEGKGGGVVIRRHPESVRAVYAARQEELEDADTAEELERLRRLL